MELVLSCMPLWLAIFDPSKEVSRAINHDMDIVSQKPSAQPRPEEYRLWSLPVDSSPSPTPSPLCDLSFITCEMGVPASEGSWEVTPMCMCKVLKTGPGY